MEFVNEIHEVVEGVEGDACHKRGEVKIGVGEEEEGCLESDEEEEGASPAVSEERWEASMAE